MSELILRQLITDLNALMYQQEILTREAMSRGESFTSTRTTVAAQIESLVGAGSKLPAQLNTSLCVGYRMGLPVHDLSLK